MCYKSNNLQIRNISRLYTPVMEGDKIAIKMVEDAVVVIRDGVIEYVGPKEGDRHPDKTGQATSFAMTEDTPPLPPPTIVGGKPDFPPSNEGGN